MSSEKKFLGQITLHFKNEIPESAKAIPHAEIDTENKKVSIPFAYVTPRPQSVDITVNGDSYRFTLRTVQKVIGGKDQIIFGKK